MPTLQVRIGHVYGTPLVYPVCDSSKLFAKIAGTKTLTKETINIIKEMGYIIQVEQPTLD